MRVIDHKPQMKADTARGQRAGDMCRLTPEAPYQLRDRPRERAGIILPVRLGAGFGPRPFGRLSGCINTQLAKPINHPLSDERLKNFAKGSKRHSTISDLLRPNRNNAGGQIVGHRGQSERSHFA